MMTKTDSTMPPIAPRERDNRHPPEQVVPAQPALVPTRWCPRRRCFSLNLKCVTCSVNSKGSRSSLRCNVHRSRLPRTGRLAPAACGRGGGAAEHVAGIQRAMQLAGQGHDAQEIAARCGISVAEAGWCSLCACRVRAREPTKPRRATPASSVIPLCVGRRRAKRYCRADPCLALDQEPGRRGDADAGAPAAGGDAAVGADYCRSRRRKTVPVFRPGARRATPLADAADDRRRCGLRRWWGSCKRAECGERPPSWRP